MLLDDILAKLRADEAALRACHVRRIGVFGSVARGEERPVSDVDILVEYRDDDRPGLFDLVDLKDHLDDLLQRPVDLATPRALHPALRDRIMDEVVRA